MEDFDKPTLEFNVEELTHLRNYLKFALNYVTDIYNKETDPNMAEVEREELPSIKELYISIGNFIAIWK